MGSQEDGVRTNWIGTIVLGVLLAAPAGAENTATNSAKASAVTKKAAKPTGEKTTKRDEADKNENNLSREGSPGELELQQLREMMLEQARELEAQRTAMREQQQKLEALAAELREARSRGAVASSTGNAPVPVEALGQSQEELNNKIGKLEKELSDTKKSVEGRLKSFGPFSFSGDLRVRYEPFFGGGPSNLPAPQDRHRERYRLRLNANAKFNDEFSGGLSIASGDPGDPISTNQTLTGFFVRKPILIDKAFATYNPAWFKPFQVTAGKWAYTWYRTELTWDNDLNPEGVSESFVWNWKDSFLQRFGVVAFQMPVLEVSGGKDSAVFGEQIQTYWRLHDRIKLGANVAFYNYRQPNAIAANQNGSLGSFGAGFGGSANTNNFGLINGVRTFASKFGVLDAIARLDVDTGIGPFPVMLLFDFAQNTKACENVGAFVAAGVTPPACNPRQRHGYWAEVQFGRTQEQGDMRFGYTFIRIERDAVVAAFNFSDLRQPTNGANHRVEYYYQWNKNIQVGWTGLFGRQLGLVTAGTPPAPVKERFLKRLQFDLIYKF